MSASWNMPVSNATRVRVDFSEKMLAATLPVSGWCDTPGLQHLFQLDGPVHQ